MCLCSSKMKSDIFTLTSAAHARMEIPNNDNTAPPPPPTYRFNAHTSTRLVWIQFPTALFHDPEQLGIFPVPAHCPLGNLINGVKNGVNLM